MESRSLIELCTDKPATMDGPSRNARIVLASFSAAPFGSSDPMISETTASPSNAWFVDDTPPCKTRRAFFDLMPPVGASYFIERN
jgi:hypothetical protein